MANCDPKVTTDLLFICADKPIKGLAGSKGVLINIADIDRSGSTEVKSIISDLVLLSGKTGYQVEWYKDLASGNSAFAPSTEDIDGFLHNFLSRLSNSSAENADRANELKNGRFVMVVETKYKGVDNAEAFKVYGWKNGMKLAEMVNSTAENSGASLYTLSTEEGDVEDYPYMIFLEVDYATSKATYDALFVQV